MKQIFITENLHMCNHRGTTKMFNKTTVTIRIARDRGRDRLHIKEVVVLTFVFKM